MYVGIAIDESTLVRKSRNKDFSNHFWSNISNTTINSEPTGDNHAMTKSYADSPSGNDRIRRDLSLVFNDQDTDFDENKYTKSVSITANGHPN